jgi:hypothetical protein
MNLGLLYKLKKPNSVWIFLLFYQTTTYHIDLLTLGLQLLILTISQDVPGFVNK